MRKYFLVFVLMLLIPVISFIRYNRNPYYVINGFTQGTTYRVIYKIPFTLTYIVERQYPVLTGTIDTLLAEFDRSLSIYHPGSIISRINRNEDGVVTDRYFREVFLRAEELTRITEGAFDITVGPLVNAWGFGPQEGTNPDSLQVDSLLQLVGMDKVRIEGNSVVKDHPGIRLDVNAIAQGYAVDILAEFLENTGVRNYLVEIGGEIKTRGSKKKGEPWLIGFDKPLDNNLMPGKDLQIILEVHNISLATSGNYRKFFEQDGIKFAHSIDPKTGYPVRHRLLSVTLTAADCMTADALATACMVSGLEKSIELVKSLESVEAYFVFSDDKGAFQSFMTDGFEKYIRDLQP